MTVDEARLAAHERAMQTDPKYRQLMDRLNFDVLLVKAKVRRRPHTRRMWSVDDLPMPRVFMHGPRWRSAFGVSEIPIAVLDPERAHWHRPGRKLLTFTLEEDVRERVCVEIRPGVVAEWMDPGEWL